jgi:type I restriction enzyme S subunit
VRWKPYPRYKPSGVEWLGEVPERWKFGNIRRFATMKTGHTPSRQHPEYWEYCTVSWFTLADVWQLRDGTRKYLNGTAELISKHGLANSSAELLPAGTVVLSRTASVGYSGIMPQPMATSQDFWNWVCGPSLAPSFLLYQFRAMAGEFRRLTMGSTHNTIYKGDAASLVIAVPPIDEQHTIADFLDRETARLDTLIEKKRQLIERLREKRTALISHTVTRGLPPDEAARHGLPVNPPLKDSGVEWIGEVPAHWEVGNIRRFAAMKTGHTPSRQHPEYWEDCRIPWFTLADVWQLRDGRQTFLGETAELISEIGLACSSAELLPAGTVVLSRTASVGFSGVMPRPMATSQDFWNWLCGKDLLPEYLLYQLRAMSCEFERLTMGSTHRTIYKGDAASFVICCPPMPEQTAIAAYLDRETAKIDRLADTIQEAIERLQEYRAALITAAVTGKIDVREEAAERHPMEAQFAKVAEPLGGETGASS